MVLSDDDMHKDTANRAAKIISFKEEPDKTQEPTSSKHGASLDYDATVRDSDDRYDEPPQFKKLSASDQRFLEEADAYAWDLEKKGNIAGLIAGILLCVVNRRRRRLPLMALDPSQRTRIPLWSETDSIDFLRQTSTNYTMMAVYGNIFASFLCHTWAWASIRRKLRNNPDVERRLEQAFGSNHTFLGSNALHDYRKAWRKCQTNLSISEWVWYCMENI